MRDWILNAINVLIGVRKLLVIFVLYAVGVYMKVSGHLTGDQFVNLVKSCTVAYFGANGVEHVTSAYKSRLGKPLDQVK